MTNPITVPEVSDQSDAFRFIIEGGIVHSVEPIGRISNAAPGEVALGLTTIVIGLIRAEENLALDLIIKAQRAALGSNDIEVETPKGLLCIRPTLGEVWVVRRDRVERFCTIAALTRPEIAAA